MFIRDLHAAMFQFSKLIHKKEAFIIFVVNFIKFIKQANIPYYAANESV